MPEQQPDTALHAQLRLFCELMLGSTDAADHVLQQLYRRALPDQREDHPPERIQLFRIAADLCDVRNDAETRPAICWGAWRLSR